MDEKNEKILRRMANPTCTADYGLSIEVKTLKEADKAFEMFEKMKDECKNKK